MKVLVIAAIVIAAIPIPIAMTMPECFLGDDQGATNRRNSAGEPDSEAAEGEKAEV